MSEREEETSDKLGQRLTDCEMLLAHLERTVQELNGVVIEQQRQIGSLEQKLERLRTAWGAIQSSEPQERKPEDEKPPHY